MRQANGAAHALARVTHLCISITFDHIPICIDDLIMNEI